MGKHYKTYDIDLDDAEWLLLAKDAHDRGITLNQHVVNIVTNHASSVIMAESKKLQKKIDRLELELAEAKAAAAPLGYPDRLILAAALDSFDWEKSDYDFDTLYDLYASLLPEEPGGDYLGDPEVNFDLREAKYRLLPEKKRKNKAVPTPL